MKIVHNSFCECGPRRNNEDFIAFLDMREQNRVVFVLCDGMGGHNLGEVASHFVAEHICDYWVKNPKRKDSEKKVIDACIETMIAFNNKSRVEMGTTMAMVAIEDNRALMAHCGDSRIYLIRDHEIVYQSKDHIRLSPEGWPLISKAFFTRHDNYLPEIKEFELCEGDRIFICSDGVYGNRKEGRLQDMLVSDGCSLENLELIASSPAHDNYSGILLQL